MGRAPCCDKVGLKKGPWTPEEDQILISFIHNHGHSNWRALPKQAGLLRCGKSCRLRWINYLKPDIKRGNFTKEEEDTIIQLHEMMGNRWSAIAGRLPGRTDNEIKNVWHTHLKKKVNQSTKTENNVITNTKKQRKTNNTTTITSYSTSTSNSTSSDLVPTFSQQSNTTTTTSDGFSSVTEVSSIEETTNIGVANDDNQSGLDDFPIIDETFWSSEDFSSNKSDISAMFPNNIDDSQLQHLQFSEDDTSAPCNNFSSLYNDNYGPENYGESMDFWLDVFVKAGGVPELPEF